MYVSIRAFLPSRKIIAKYLEKEQQIYIRANPEIEVCS